MPVINHVVYRLPQGDAQDNYTELLDSVATHLESLKEYDVLDLSLVDVVDKDAIDRPEIHTTLRRHTVVC